MKMTSNYNVWLLLTVLLAAPMVAAPLPRISVACSGSDTIVVGTLHRPAGAATANVTVLQILKGQSVANAVLPALLPRLSTGGVDPEEDFAAIVFLKQDGSAWRLLSVGGDNAPLISQVLPANNLVATATTVAQTCEDQVFARTLDGLNDGNIAWYRLPIADLFYGYDSPAYRMLLGQLSQSTNPEFRAMGIEGRLGLGDVSALQQIEKEAASLKTGTLAEVGVVLETYRNPDVGGIAELGKLAALSDGTYPDLLRSTARCLHTIHTIDTLPVLYRLLDSADPAVRLEAMFGFAKFVANFPIHRPEDGPSNKNITPLPGKTYTTGDGQSHFPTIGADNQATLAFWKAWYQANFVNRH